MARLQRRSKIERGDFSGNVVARRGLRSRSAQLAKIGKPVDRGEWGMTPPTVNAYYNPQMNDINFPAGVLQPPLYDPKMDDAPNYGNTGSHDRPRADARVRRRGPAVRRAGQPEGLVDAGGRGGRSRSACKCVQDQYAQYTIVDDIKINRKLTSGEDVADLGGTLLAYSRGRRPRRQKLQPIGRLHARSALLHRLRAVGVREPAAGEAARLNAITNPHSPGRYRINGVVVEPAGVRRRRSRASRPADGSAAGLSKSGRFRAFRRFRDLHVRTVRTRSRIRTRAIGAAAGHRRAPCCVLRDADSAQTPPNLAGKWTLNRALSQWPREVGFDVDFNVPPIEGQEGTERGARGRRPPSRMMRPESEDEARRVRLLTDEVREPPASVTVTQSETDITFSDEHGRSRTFHPTGKEEVIDLGGVPSRGDRAVGRRAARRALRSGARASAAVCLLAAHRTGPSYR